MSRGNEAPTRPPRARKKGSAVHKQEAALLSARGIVNRFGEQLVHDDIDLDIFRGEILGIAGGSGSGKSYGALASASSSTMIGQSSAASAVAKWARSVTVILAPASRCTSARRS